MSEGQMMYQLVERLFPICRSITGDGVRETLSILKEYISDLKIYEVPSGTKVFDWVIPKEWRIREAYIENGKGEKIVDMKENNLHVMGYSAPLDKYVDLQELKQYIYVQEDQPDAIPYVTSYYKERSGFCMSRNMRDALPEDRYHMYIDSELFDGSLTYGEMILPGKTEKEVLLSTYLCHPSMANNELSGPAVVTALVRWFDSLKDRKYTYRIVFIPETIGSITYLSRNLEEMKQRVIAGYVLSCVGDNRTYSYIPSRDGNTLADRAAKNVLRFHYPEYRRYTFLDRGSDERQYNAPGVDLPVCVVCRSKYGEFPEYHTSLDNLSLVTPEGLEGALDAYRQMIMAIEYNVFYRIKCLCEPQLGKRGLYPTVSKKGSY
ncbi:MAG: DUF4910 domain-containing protein, partial [Acetatifactor sp.]|nr:DUF4910 domain-containing protein [Acetatifactor sp.]